MDGREIVRRGYNQIAADYLRLRWIDSEDLRLLPAFAERLPEGGRVLDAGCGAGEPVTAFLARHFEVVGVDFAEKQLHLARKLAPGARFVCQDMVELGLAENFFDGICSYYAIIHIPRHLHPVIFSQFRRVLKPGGFALLCLGAVDIEADIDENYLGARMFWSHYGREKNLDLLTESGFSVIWSKLAVDSSYPASSHLFVLAQKSKQTTQ